MPGYPFRRPVAAAVTLAVLLPLAACSQASDAEQGGPTTITLSMQNPDVKTADPATWAIVEAFESANPDVDVEVSGQPVAEHLQSLSIAAQSDTLPDVFWVYKSNAEEMLAGDRLLDLQPILEEQGVIDSLPATTVEYFTSDGTVFGVPYQGLLTGLWTNTQVLSDHGLSTPTTFDELLQVAETLADEDVVTISNGASQSAFSVWQFLVWLDRFGFEERMDGLLDGSESWENPDFVRMYEHIAELRDAGAFSSNVSTQTYQQAVDQFLQGEAAFLDAGVWAAGAIQDSEVAPHTTFWKGPTFADGVGEQNIIMNVASAPLVVAKKVGEDEAKLDAVERFLGFYYSDEAQQLMVDNGQPPVTTYEPELDEEEQSVLKSALDAAREEGVSTPGTQPDLVFPVAVSNAIYDSIYGVIQDQLTPEEAAALVQRALDAE
ncbi:MULTISPECIES: ABC transporter substrate-binding protein [unclassified Isoptericola]|uniref:ABC transporter substrate-binding protein n=1 Tax=unclassified Isoptericola TaxID=2623355 RepID=UPI002714437F|nr:MULTISPECIES: ABC transporter substrate-binding protein [unclassified Isoptericola]MDO8147695.1 ABC transporter substrate-binding protein [Isoptericola sp. b515]MDO8150001.1 ABC transporter substrate-binding protein [Isoptericola sp. b408]